jgi:hypothetical protein
MDAATLRRRIAAWTAAHPATVLYDETGEILRDVPSGKTLALPAGRIARAEEKQNRETGGTYLVMLRDDGLQIVLADPGIAWEPSPENAGPLRDVPPVVCWQDFERITAHLRHRLRAHPDEPPGRDAVDLVMLGIALLDGARKVGFTVDDEERSLDALLSEIERRSR